MIQDKNMDKTERLLRTLAVEHPSEDFRERLNQRLQEASHTRSPETLLRLEEWLLGFSLLAIVTAVVLFADLGFIGRYAFDTLALLPEWLMNLNMWFFSALEFLNNIPALVYLTAAALLFLWITDRYLLRLIRRQKAFLYCM